MNNTQPIGPEAVNADFNKTLYEDKIHDLIVAINTSIEEKIASQSGGVYDNGDGTFDKFRCVIYFDDNDRFYSWKDFHQHLMEAYRKAGWIVKPWLPGLTKKTAQVEFSVPAYCLVIPQRPIAEIIEELGGIRKP